MERALKEKWVEMLRSGKYEQTVGRLRRTEQGNSRYCCLGVLCLADGIKFNSNDEPLSLFASAALVRPEHFGFTNEQLSMLTRKNDREGDTFNQIADWIEENISVKEAGNANLSS